ncbi:hypothetical protein L9F63_006194, partial [Diploptera punctata]
VILVSFSSNRAQYTFLSSHSITDNVCFFLQTLFIPDDTEFKERIQPALHTGSVLTCILVVATLILQVNAWRVDFCGLASNTSTILFVVSASVLKRGLPGVDGCNANCNLLLHIQRHLNNCLSNGNFIFPVMPKLYKIFEIVGLNKRFPDISIILMLIIVNLRLPRCGA